MSKKSLLLTALTIAALWGAQAGAASAATLFLSPATGSYGSGQTFSVGVFVASGDTAMNAASGVISFPQDKLQVVSLSRTGSIMTLWAQEPSYSNSVGTVNFEGIVLNPGYQGAAGKLLSITFRVRGTGSATVSFASGSVLANDGKGTNILEGFGNAQFGLKVSEAGPQTGEGTTPVGILGTPLAPTIASPTHPDPDGWYAGKAPKFSWPVPTGVTAVRLLYDDSPRSIPTVVYDPAIAEKELKGVDDGAWYLHAQFRNDKGWGSIAHFRFQIDSRPPEKFAIRVVGDEDLTSPRPVVLFNTADTLSGIDYYKVKVGDRDFFSVRNEEVASNPYTLPPEAPGTHTILVQAFDRAGNYETAVTDFTIESIAMPTIIEYPATIAEGSPLVVKGVTLPFGKVSVWFQREGDLPKRYTVLADKDGNFTLAGDGDLKKGQYQLWAEVEDERGAKSLPTDKLAVTVTQTEFFRIGSFAVDILAIIVSVAGLLVLGGALLWYVWRRLAFLRGGLKKEMRDVERNVHHAFESLRGDLRDHIRALEKAREERALSREEEKMLEQLRRSLDKAERLIEKEIEDVEKKVK